jgi:hypothetical protein
MLVVVDFQKTAAQTCSSVPNRAGREEEQERKPQQPVVEAPVQSLLKSTVRYDHDYRTICSYCTVPYRTYDEKVSVWGDTRTDPYGTYSYVSNCCRGNHSSTGISTFKVPYQVRTW